MAAPAAKFLLGRKERGGKDRPLHGRARLGWLSWRRYVERQFEIIGEALAAVRRVEPDVAVRIPELARIIAFRNILIHGYATVDDRLVWGIVEGDLAGLRQTLERLLDESSKGEAH